MSGSSVLPGEGGLRIGRALREAALLLVLALGVALFLALVSYSPDDPGWTSTGRVETARNWVGALGAWCADALLATFGVAAFAVPLGAVLLTIAHWRSVPGCALLPVFRGSAASLGMLGVCVLGAVNVDPEALALPYGAGGLVGLTLLRAGLPALGVAGLNGAGVLLLLIGTTLVTGISWPALLEHLGALLRRGGLALVQGLAAAAIGLLGALRLGALTVLRGTAGVVAGAGTRGLAALRARVPRPAPEPDGAPTPASEPAPTRATTPARRDRKGAVRPAAPAAEDPPRAAGPPVAEAQGVTVEEAEHRAGLVDPERPSRRVARERQKPLFEGAGALPRLDLLDDDDAPRPAGVSRDALSALGKRLELKLRDFGVEATVVVVNPGPVITRFEIQPAPGVKVSKISGLAKDLARSLAVISVRIVEVIPGKSTVGIEIPNEQRELVRLRAVLSTDAYDKAPGPLALALGKDIAGHASVVNLAKMPHLLVAGTTGSGKSVGVNAMLLSLLYRATPEEVRLILVDPKMLELSVYEGIPHLLAPVVTDMNHAAGALRWCVGEMERRYQLMAALGVRNLAGFNQRVKEATAAGEPIPDPLWDAENAAPDDEIPTLEALPYIVVCIDEFADMMMIVGKKVEQLIARIAQKARAAGIHLLLATQRPSVDVITGLIKANVPARIAFQVSSKVDSRTILDQGGAEQLLGHGDMLYLPPGSPVPTRVHGAFVSDDEVHRVVADWKRRGRAEYVPELMDPESSESAFDVSGLSGGAGEPSDPEQDELYDEAVRCVLETRRASISGVQRKLRIGYNRAARLIEAMEAAGLVSPASPAGQREVLIPERDT